MLSFKDVVTDDQERWARALLASHLVSEVVYCGIYKIDVCDDDTVFTSRYAMYKSAFQYLQTPPNRTPSNAM